MLRRTILLALMFHWIASLLAGCASREASLAAPKEDLEGRRSGSKTRVFSVVCPPVYKGIFRSGKVAEFRVPAEGDLLSDAIPEGIGGYDRSLSGKINLYLPMMEERPEIFIRSYPLLEPVSLHPGIGLVGSPAPENHFLARPSWDAIWWEKSFWGTMSRHSSHGEPGIRELEIAGKRFQEIFVRYGKPSPPENDTPGRQYFHLGKDRVYSFSFRTGIPSDVDQAVLAGFTPIDVQRTREAILLERALHYWQIGPSEMRDPGTRQTCIPFTGCWSRDGVSDAFRAVLREDPENCLAHLFLGMHHLSTGLPSFTPAKGLPEDVRRKDAERVFPKEDYDHYRLNPIWVYDRRIISAYLLRGDFEVTPAMEEFENALRIRPSSYAARYYLSWLYARTGEYDKALATLHEMERIVPGDRDARLLLLGIYQITGKQAEGKAMQEDLQRDLSRRTLVDELGKILGPALGEAIGMAITGGFR